MFLSHAFEASLRGSVEDHSSPQVECQSSSVQVIKSAGPKVSKRIASTTHTEINRWPTCILLPSSNYLIYSSCHRHPITLLQASRTLNCGPLFPAPGQLELWISECNHCPGLVFVPGSYCRSHPSTILYLQSRRTCRPDLSWAALHLICVQ